MSVARRAARQGPSKVIIWHNAKCATSRKVLGLIRDKGIEPEIIEYLKNPPSPAEIRAVLKEMGIGPRALLRPRGSVYDNLGLNSPKWTDAELIAAMAEHPVLIERPVVRTRKGTRLCRPMNRVLDVL